MGRLHGACAVGLMLESWSRGTQPPAFFPPPPPRVFAAPVELCPLDHLQTGVRTRTGKQTTPGLCPLVVQLEPGQIPLWGRVLNPRDV